MPFYAVNMTHPAASCPIFNDEVKKRYREGVARREELAKKYKIRVLTACVAVLEHVIFYVVEAPSQSAVEGYFTEIGFAFYNNVAIREVQLLEEAWKVYGIT